MTTPNNKGWHSSNSSRCFCKDCYVFSSDMKIVVTQENGHRIECGFCPIQASYVPFLWSCSKWKNKLKKLDVALREHSQREKLR